MYDNEDIEIISKHYDLNLRYNDELFCVILANEYYNRKQYEKMDKFCKLSVKNKYGCDVAMHILGRYHKNENVLWYINI
jgi:hypothetical protein